MISDLQMQIHESKMWIEYGKQEFQHYNDMLEESKEQHGYTWMYVKELQKRLTELGKKD